MIKLILIVFLLMKILLVNAQSVDFSWVEDYNIKGFVAADKLGNLFSIENGVLIRYDEKGEVLRYSNRRHGPVTFVDVADPLNILVFFGHFGAVGFLDRNFTEKNLLTASDLHEFDIPAAVAISSQGGFWVYFAHDFKLVRFSNRGVAEVNSLDLNQKFPGFATPSFLLESEDRLFVSGNDLWVFDFFATFLFQIPGISKKAVQVRNNKVFFLDNDVIHLYDLVLHTQREIELPDTNILSFFLVGDIIYLQTKTAVKKYRYTGIF